ncbi:hypothetical protein K32_16890 [Kaistia sp. 32K]|uniref:nucleotidyltransferase domain-containing protein n=1 Tax=Kaistia sp. 32K TaxID=2795690 RepID=UPI001915EFC0|nr:amino acid transporter [Kaistia sp. 32K]BCP53072.1 hypothetical protein K32_16890 [Kaistia sp. 32K]
MTTSAIPDDDAWTAWHPAELGQRLRGIGRPWHVVGGWALDLWHGRETREHEDLEFAVLRDDLDAFRHALAGMQFFTAGSGIVAPLPDGADPAPEIFQIWCLDPLERRWRVDMMIEPGTPDEWVYRRDPRLVRRRAEMIATTADGLPYLKPAAVLLFKAKHVRGKDELDFAKALPKLETAERAWLKASLQTLHPGHPWIDAL